MRIAPFDCMPYGHVEKLQHIHGHPIEREIEKRGRKKNKEGKKVKKKKPYYSRSRSFYGVFTLVAPRYVVWEERKVVTS